MIDLKEKESFFDKTKHDFYNYVITFPNTYYFEYDRKILNQIENQIIDDIVRAIRITEKEQNTKYGYSIILDVIAYIFFFNSLIKGKNGQLYFMELLFQLLINFF